MNVTIVATGAVVMLLGALAFGFRRRLAPRVEAAPVFVSVGPVFARSQEGMRQSRRQFFVASALGAVAGGVALVLLGFGLPP